MPTSVNSVGSVRPEVFRTCFLYLQKEAKRQIISHPKRSADNFALQNSAERTVQDTKGTKLVNLCELRGLRETTPDHHQQRSLTKAQRALSEDGSQRTEDGELFPVEYSSTGQGDVGPSFSLRTSATPGHVAKGSGAASCGR